MNFINQIKNSIYSLEFYKSLNHKNSSYTIFYALKLSATMGLLLSAFFAFGILAGLSSLGGESGLSQKVSEYLSTNIPEGYTLSLKEGTLVSNTQGKVVLPFPFTKEFTESFSKDFDFKNLIVVDTDNVYNKENLDSASTVIYLAKDMGSAYDQNKKQYTLINYSEIDNGEIKDLSITKEQALYYSNLAVEIFYSWKNVAIVFFFLLSILFSTLFFFLGMLVFALWTGLLAFLFNMYFKKEGDFGHWYLKAIHADTLPVILSYLLGLSFVFIMLPFLYTAVVLLILFVNHRK